MNARVGFDWSAMPHTVEGFRRFLHFIEAEIADFGPYCLDPHWGIQARISHPTVFRPTLTGRVEAMGDFYRDLADRLDRPLPADISLENRQPDPAQNLAGDPEARALVERIYAEDFESFSY
ncbi:hypothetical protein [Sinisalibacter aestuarii]|uniref:Uncharacterized protein n=1 Tax=Sinisalibacter aestuarii TaxID=2949426 RepID=A0ABQ5LR98_9RHOB|nr:hypothetical protein [Sinisalibacter aestuarii]GKY87529.1 hypothetical protein STA1M1_13980 [Sinisalibacter aestuarii]